MAKEKKWSNRHKTCSKKPSRRTVLKQLSIGAVGTTTLSSFMTTSGARQSNYNAEQVKVVENQQQNAFSDAFEDGELDWTDTDHPEFWTEKNGMVHYNPSSSAGSTGQNQLYANATFSGDQGLLE
jgi:hypothetical protein